MALSLATIGTKRCRTPPAPRARVCVGTPPADPCGRLNNRPARDCAQLGCGACDEHPAPAVQRVGVCFHLSSLVAVSASEMITSCCACQSICGHHRTANIPGGGSRKGFRCIHNSNSRTCTFRLCEAFHFEAACATRRRALWASRCQLGGRRQKLVVSHGQQRED